MPNCLLETQHLKVPAERFGHLADQIIEEAIRSVMINCPPYEMSLGQVQNKAQMYAAGKIRGFVDNLNVIRHKPSSKSAGDRSIEAQWERLVKEIRLHLREELLDADRKILFKARKRFISQAKHAVFRVTTSSVQLHRLERTRLYGQSPTHS